MKKEFGQTIFILDDVDSSETVHNLLNRITSNLVQNYNYSKYHTFGFSFKGKELIPQQIQQDSQLGDYEINSASQDDPSVIGIFIKSIHS